MKSWKQFGEKISENVCEILKKVWWNSEKKIDEILGKIPHGQHKHVKSTIGTQATICHVITLHEKNEVCEVKSSARNGRGMKFILL